MKFSVVSVLLLIGTAVAGPVLSRRAQPVSSTPHDTENSEK